MMAGSKFLEDANAALTLAAQSGPRRALFLDRDGVINVDRGYVHTKENTEWLPGIFDLCRVAIADGLLLVVVTNQAGIARGLYSESEFIAYTQWMHEEFSRNEAPLLATYFCPHHPVAGIGKYLVHCQCRKPAPGMIVDAAERYGIILAKSSLIGNRGSDIEAGVAAGIGQSILLEDSYNKNFVEDGMLKVGSLEAAKGLLKGPESLHARSISVCQ